MPLSFVAILLLIPLLLYIYIRLNDAKLMNLPSYVEDTFSPHRVTDEDATRTAARLAEIPITVKSSLSPQTGRRYIIVGGVSSKPGISCA